MVAMESAPLMGRRLPSSDSSPRNRMFFSSVFSSAPVVPRIPSAMGRSNPEPSFFTSAGARFTVMVCQGNSKPQFLMADLMRSLLSRTAASGRPTVRKKALPAVMSTSTSTG